MQQPTLPKGVSQAAFESAVSEYRELLGEDNVVVDTAKLDYYVEKLLPEPSPRHQAAGALKVSSTEEVQQVVRIANKYKTPLWPISTGGNCGYGSAAPATPGQLVLDLRGMNKILAVDKELCTALVEPGVTYRQIVDYLNKHQLDMWMSFPASNKLGGPVGNTLDRGVGFNRNGEHVANFCGLEVVTPSGDVLRTGLGGVGEGQAWQTYRWGFGPWVDGLFSQSNLGIVTKMGLWLMKKPEKSVLVMATWEEEEQFAEGLCVGAALKRDGTFEAGVNAGDSWYGIAQTLRREDLYKGKDAIPEDVLAKYRKEHKAPHFALNTNVYGTEQEVDAKIKRAKELLEATGATFISGSALDGNSGAEHAKRQGTGVLDDDELGLLNYRPGPGEAWFSPVVPARPKDILASYRLARDIFRKYGFEYIGGFVVNPRAGEHVIDLIFNRNDAEETERAYRCFEEAMREHAKLGYGVYRTNTAFMELAAECYGPAQRAFNKQLKQALDPNGIIAPGKSGIHP